MMLVRKASVTKFRCMWVFPLAARYIRNVRNILDIRSSQILEGRNKTAKFSSCHNLSTLHNTCFVLAPLTLFQNNFADRGTLLVMPTSSRGKNSVISCGPIRSPHSGHYDTLCFSPVILSCLNHVMAIWQCRGEGRTENTLALWLLQGLRDGENDDLCWQ